MELNILWFSFETCFESSLRTKIERVTCGVYTESHERKHSLLKSLFTDVFQIDFAIRLPHLLTCRLISVHVHFYNGSFIFCNRSLEIMVVEIRSLWWDLHCKLSFLFMFDLRPCFHIQKKIILSLGKLVSKECQKIWKYIKEQAFIILKCKFEPKNVILNIGVHF